MSLMSITARIMSKCKHCGKKFEQDPRTILKGLMDEYCGDACIAEAAPEYVCQACGGANDPTKARYGLPICAPCQELAWWSCWRKRWFPSSFEAGQWIKIYEATGLRRPLTPYPCPLCVRWHASSWSIFEVASDEFKAAINAIATVFRAHNFDIDQARGWTNMPDGTHELREAYDNEAGRAAAERMLRRNRIRKAA